MESDTEQSKKLVGNMEEKGKEQILLEKGLHLLGKSFLNIRLFNLKSFNCIFCRGWSK